MEMNARSYPRTMEGAFGPYHRSSVCPIQPMPTPKHDADAVVLIGSLIAGVALIVLLVLENV